MKKIYLILLSVLGFQIAEAQLTLTKAVNEPVLGDMSGRQGFDSTGVLPKNTGAGQTWNFTAIVVNTVTSASTFTTVASTPSASSFPSATLAEDQGGGAYNYWKSTTTNYEMVGIVDPTTPATLNFTNSAIVAVWPISYGYTNTDNLAGTCSVAGNSGTFNGNISTNASGSGTLMLPGGLNFSNVLQVKSNQTVNLNLLGGFVTATLVTTGYQYYHSSQKFSILDVNYQDISGAFSSSTGDISVNNNVLLGITDPALDLPNFTFYPNPATDKLSVILDNKSAQHVSIVILNHFGQVVKAVDMGNESDIFSSVDVSGLSSGIYFVKTSIGEKSATKKLVIQ